MDSRLLRFGHLARRGARHPSFSRAGRLPAEGRCITPGVKRQIALRGPQVKSEARSPNDEVRSPEDEVADRPGETRARSGWMFCLLVLVPKRGLERVLLIGLSQGLEQSGFAIADWRLASCGRRRPTPCGSFWGIRMYTIAYIPRPAEKHPNFTNLNSLSTIRAFCPPLPPGLQSKRILNEVEVKVEIEVWSGR